MCYCSGLGLSYPSPPLFDPSDPPPIRGSAESAEEGGTSVVPSCNSTDITRVGQGDEPAWMMGPFEQPCNPE